MILIVDDRPENIISLKSILELHKFKVDTATSGEEALKKILTTSYFLIILDVQMPDMDGFEVAETLSGYSKAKDIPIIFLSAINIEKKYITKGYTSGGIDYVTKPFDPDILILKVKTFYKIYEQTQELNAIQQTLRKEIEYRKQAEYALSLKVDELQSILESIPNVAFTANTEGDIEFVNQHWFTYAASKSKLPQTIGKPCVRDVIQKALETGETVKYEVCMQALSGEDCRYHMLHMTPVKKTNGIAKWVGIFHDIHDEKMANQVLEERVAERTAELENTNKLLEKRNNELQQFAYVSSHDLKEPLRKIQIFSNLLKDKYLPEDSEATMYINRVIHSSARMTALINDVLMYSRLALKESFKVTDVQEIINGVLTDLELQIADKQATIHLADLPEMEVIATQIRQLFQNLLSNALKFSKKGQSPEIHITHTVVNAKGESATEALPLEERYSKITVQDNGIGFNEVYLDKIFSIFQRLNPADEYEGTGIGLAIAKKIVDNHHGSITAQSKENEGASFIILLPHRQPVFNNHSSIN